MGFETNAIKSIRQNRNLQRHTRRSFRERGKTCFPPPIPKMVNGKPAVLHKREEVFRKEMKIKFYCALIAFSIGFMFIYLLL